MLNGDTISLRPVTEQDVDALHATTLDLETRGPWYPLPAQSLTKYRASFAETGLWTTESGTFVIVDAEDRLLGVVQYGKAESYGSDYELAYRLFDRSSMGRGIATEAVGLAVDHLFDWLPIHRLILYIDVDNIPSHRVAEKCGFTKEGTLREAFFNRGAWHDLSFFSLIREERDERRARGRSRSDRAREEDLASVR